MVSNNSKTKPVQVMAFLCLLKLIGNQTMSGILTGCFGAGQQNSVKPTQYHTILKVGKIPHISEKNVEMVIES